MTLYERIGPAGRNQEHAPPQPAAVLQLRAAELKA
jgi:hypothetical protein